MPTRSKVWGIRLVILLATCFGVFVLPFLLPAPYFKGVSASNLAGFNNKVAALAAAGLGTLVFFLALKWPQIMQAHGGSPARGEDLPRYEYVRLPRLLVTTVVLLWAGATLLFGLQIIRLGIGYTHDWGYFINRISMYADYGRSLYTQIEFSYGPLLFYGPVAVKLILSPFHMSETGSYLATLVLEITIGLLLLAYLINHLPMSKQWKAVIFSLFAVGMFVGNMGLNHTFLRFASPLAFLVLTSQRTRPWSAALWILAGQAVCLGLSPEMGFAFFVGSFAFALYRCFTQGRSWLLGVAAPILSTMAFLLMAGRSYLRMLGMVSHGVYNFPIEPLPYVLVFLFALVWLVPVALARFFRQQRPEAPMLAALYLMSVALLPAAFGRADPGHLFWNGVSLFLLSAVAVSSKRMWQQIAWGVCLALTILWMTNINRSVNWFEMRPVLHAEAASCRDLLEGRRLSIAREDDGGFNLQILQAIVGHAPVATPDEIPLQVEESLRESGQYTPAFYDFSMSLLDADAEERQMREFNQSKWALIPVGETYGYAERPEDLKLVLGFQLPYRSRRPVYAEGLQFAENLAENWRVCGRVGNYLVYEHANRATNASAD
jgi:hypothetical protein